MEGGERNGRRIQGPEAPMLLIHVRHVHDAPAIYVRDGRVGNSIGSENTLDAERLGAMNIEGMRFLTF